MEHTLLSFDKLSVALFPFKEHSNRSMRISLAMEALINLFFRLIGHTRSRRKICLVFICTREYFSVHR